MFQLLIRADVTIDHPAGQLLDLIQEFFNQLVIFNFKYKPKEKKLPRIDPFVLSPIQSLDNKMISDCHLANVFYKITFLIKQFEKTNLKTFLLIFSYV